VKAGEYTNPKQERETKRVNEGQYKLAVSRLLHWESPNIVMEVLLIAGHPNKWGDSTGWSEWYDACTEYLVDRYGWKIGAKQTRAACEILAILIEKELWRAERESQHTERETRS